MFLNFIKVVWMAWWRWVVLGMALMSFKDIFPVIQHFSFMYESVALLTIAPLVIASIIVIGFKKTVLIFPIWMFLHRVNPFVDLKKYAGRKKKRKKKSGSTPATQTDGQFNSGGKATNKGRKTGYEPYILDKIQLPENNSYMHGKPGSGLDRSGFGNQAIKAGQTGEMNFAKALYMTDYMGYKINKGDNEERSFLTNVHTFWSMAIPTRDSSTYNIKRDGDADVDLIVALQHRLILVDLKFYKGGDVIYRNSAIDELVIIDKATNKPIGSPRKMSRNMEIAEDRYAKLFPHLRVESMVVLVPTSSGAGEIQGVYWPGRVKLYNIEEAIRHLAKDNDQWAEVEDVVTLSSLLK